MARGAIVQTRNRKVSLQKGVAQGSCWCPAQGIVRTLLSSLWIRLMLVYPPGIRPLRIGLVPASQSGIRPKILFQQIFGLGIIILGQNFAFCPRTFLSRYSRSLGREPEEAQDPAHAAQAVPGIQSPAYPVSQLPRGEHVLAGKPSAGFLIRPYLAREALPLPGASRRPPMPPSSNRATHGCTVR